jgi:hypothetical protein
MECGQVVQTYIFYSVCQVVIQMCHLFYLCLHSHYNLEHLHVLYL